MRKDIVNYIIEGSCKDLLSNHSLFLNKSVNLIITSPPYANQRIKSYGGIHPDKYVEWFLPISEELKRILKPKGSFVLNIKENVRKGERLTYVLELILEMKKQGWLWVEEYCWYKRNSYPGKWNNRFRDSWERCLHFTKEKEFNMFQDSVKVPIGDWAKKRFKTMSEKDFIRYVSGTNSNFGRNVSNWLNRKKVFPHNVLVFETEHYLDTSTVIELATECRNRNHSAAFPIELPSWFIKLFTKKGDIVLDPFMGVGTTALSCILLDRKYIGIEAKKEYIKYANEKINEILVLKKKNSNA